MPPLINAVAVWLAGLFAAALLADSRLFHHAANLTSLNQSAPVEPASGHQPNVLHTSMQLLLLAMVIVAIVAAARRVVRHELQHNTRSHVLVERTGHLTALALIATSALLIGVVHANTQGDCLRALLRNSSDFEIALDARATPNTHVTGDATGIGTLAQCHAPASLHVTDGFASAGSIIRIHATPRPTNRGILLAGTISNTNRTDYLRAWRGKAGEHIDSLFIKNAPLVRALLIADQTGIPPEMRDRFADAGLVHMLSISGLHVAIIAEALLIVARAARTPRTIATALSLTAVTVYVATLGAPPPAVRSAVMLAVVAITEQWQRPVHPWTALALGAAIPTYHADVVTDLGWQLSVAGMAALVAARALLRRLRTVEISHMPKGVLRRCTRYLRALKGWRAELFREVITGIVATLVTAPLIAWTFGRVSLVAPLSNITATPVVAVLQPALFLALLLAPWPPTAKLVADATTLPITVFDHLARWWASIPFATLHVAPTLATTVCAGIASALFVRTTASRHWARGLLAVVGALTVAIWAPTFARPPGRLELHMMDVGQGDALAIRTPHGRWVLVDAGRRWDGGDAGRRVVVPYIQRLGGDVALFIMTHAHDDHVGGAVSVLQSLHPVQWWEPAFITANDAYRATLAEVQRDHIGWHRVSPGDAMQLDGVSFEVLAPDSSWTTHQANANETSVVLRVQYHDVSFLLTGDAEADEEGWLLDHTPHEKLQANVLKLGHHGSRTSSTPAFLNAVQPALGLVSVGENNRYGHPSPEVLEEFSRHDVPLRRTDRDGVIVVTTDGRTIIVTDKHDTWTLGASSGVWGACQRSAGAPHC